MHPLLFSLLHATTTTVAKKTKKSSSTWPFLLIIAAFAIFYLLVLRPRSQRARQVQTAKKDFEVGDEVVSIGGIVGSVVGFDGDDIEVEVDEGVVLTFLRRAVNLRQPPAPPSAPPARGSLFGRPPRGARPAPAPADDDGFDDDDEDGASPAISGPSLPQRRSRPGLSAGGNGGEGDAAQEEDASGGSPDSPPSGR